MLLSLDALFRRKNRVRTLRLVWGVMRRQGVAGVYREYRKFANLNVAYGKWARDYDSLSEEDRTAIGKHIAAFSRLPLISVLTPTYNTPEKWLRRAIDSVRAQLYPNWELCLADDASPAPHVRAILEEYARLDSRIRVTLRSSNGHISAASNSALAICRGEFVALLDHDDELPPHALYMVAAAIDAKPDLDLIYSDEDKIDENGRRFGPYFKSDWNPDLFTAQNMISHLGVYRTELVRSVGGFRQGYEGSQDWDLALRISERIPPSHIHHIPHVLYHWRTIAGSTAAGIGEKPYAIEAAANALRDHLARTGCGGEVSLATEVHFRLRYALPCPIPLVTIVISGLSDLMALRRCIRSIHRQTRYPSYEILVVDDRAGAPASREYLDRLEAEGGARILRLPQPASPSAASNAAVRAARGSVACLMECGVEVIAEDWLEEMVGRVARDEIGVVGGMVFGPDNNTIRHAGICLDAEAIAKPLYTGDRRGAPGYMGRARLAQNLPAVSGGCLVVRKTVYQEVGGFDEDNLPDAFNEVDLCLRLMERGYRNVWTPFAEFRCHEHPADSPKAQAEGKPHLRNAAAYMRARWPSVLANDPASNPNLFLYHGFPLLALERRAGRPWQS